MFWILFVSQSGSQSAYLYKYDLVQPGVSKDRIFHCKKLLVCCEERSAVRREDVEVVEYE